VKIVVLGPDGAGKSSVVQGLMSKLTQSGCDARIRHLKPWFFLSRQGEAVTIAVDPQGRPPHSVPRSVAKIFFWLMEEWSADLFQDSKKSLLLCDRYYHDLLIDWKRYRYGGPLWAARLVGILMPHPDLWILLDAPPEVFQARKQEVSLEETKRQRQAYLAFVRKRGRRAECVLEDL
jgi:thymidylate kinase